MTLRAQASVKWKKCHTLPGSQYRSILFKNLKSPQIRSDCKRRWKRFSWICAVFTPSETSLAIDAIFRNTTCDLFQKVQSPSGILVINLFQWKLLPYVKEENKKNIIKSIEHNALIYKGEINWVLKRMQNHL